MVENTSVLKGFGGEQPFRELKWYEKLFFGNPCLREHPVQIVKGSTCDCCGWKRK
jgi:hypothetical protein